MCRTSDIRPLQKGHSIPKGIVTHGPRITALGVLSLVKKPLKVNFCSKIHVFDIQKLKTSFLFL